MSWITIWTKNTAKYKVLCFLFDKIKWLSILAGSFVLVRNGLVLKSYSILKHQKNGGIIINIVFEIGPLFIKVPNHPKVF